MAIDNKPEDAGQAQPPVVYQVPPPQPQPQPAVMSIEQTGTVPPPAPVYDYNQQQQAMYVQQPPAPQPMYYDPNTVQGQPVPPPPPGATQVIVHQQQNPYVVKDTENEECWNIDWLLFILGWLLTIPWIVGAFLPLCRPKEKRFNNSSHKSAWIANTVMAGISVLLWIIIIASA